MISPSDPAPDEEADVIADAEVIDARFGSAGERRLNPVGIEFELADRRKQPDADARHGSPPRTWLVR